jgi:hypothetical protein
MPTVKTALKSWPRENAEIEFANGNFVSTSINFEKQKRWRRLPGQDNRENNPARFSCAHVFTQPGPKGDMAMPHLRSL